MDSDFCCSSCCLYLHFWSVGVYKKKKKQIETDLECHTDLSVKKKKKKKKKCNIYFFEIGSFTRLFLPDFV